MATSHWFNESDSLETFFLHFDVDPHTEKGCPNIFWWKNNKTGGLCNCGYV